jgi:tRNA (adenine37-N6)-methyltransferase
MPLTNESAALFPMKTIGVVRCEAPEVADVPSEGLVSRVVVAPEYRRAMTGLEVGDDLFVLTVFDQANGNVLSGSADTPFESGAFSIRSSERPNRIGMTLARVTAIDDLEIHFDWLDFSDGTPVIDIKRYNWRWEVIPGTRHLDRRHIETQIPRDTLVGVLARAATKFHGEHCADVHRASVLIASLSHDHGILATDRDVVVTVAGGPHLREALMVLTGATCGNARLIEEEGVVQRVSLSGSANVVCTWEDEEWLILAQGE